MQNYNLEERQTLLTIGLLLLKQSDETMAGILSILQTPLEVESMLTYLAQFEEMETSQITEQQLMDQAIAIHKMAMRSIPTN